MVSQRTAQTQGAAFMSKLLFAIVAFGAIALAAPTIGARSSAATGQFAYLHLAPGLPAADGQLQPAGYKACEATAVEWKCRQFPSADEKPSDDGLRRAITALGLEGWEMVAVFDETAKLSYPKGQTYVFKRQVR